MKNLKSYIMGLAALAALSLGFSSCQDDVDDPAVNVPVATKQANMTILELKEKYWNDATNYADTIGTLENGEHIIIKGRVISSDEASNVFKSLIIQDETGAMPFSINSYNLYLKYRRGQEIVVDVTGMYIGKYNGYQQIGIPEWYENGSAYEVTFMSPMVFESHIELNGMPDLSKIDTLVVNSFDQLSSNPDGLRKYQGQIIRFNNVQFQNGGVDQFSTYHSSGVNEALLDVNGNSLNVRTSGYSNFWNNTLPTGRGDVVAIASYYGTSGWQLVLNDYAGCMNFGNPTIAPGTEDNPYTVAEVVNIESQGDTGSGWVTGYIVGTVAPELETVTSSADIEWTSTPTLANTLVIGATADTKDIKDCLIVALPSGSALRQYGALRDNPDVYKKQIWIKGTFTSYMGSYGLTDNTGSTDEFKIDGKDTSAGTGGGSTSTTGNGTAESPYSVAQVIAMNPSSTTTAVESGVYVTGYIVGSMSTSGSSTTLSGTNFNTSDAATTNMVIGPTADCTDYTKCIGIQLPSGAIRNALNLSQNPDNLGKQVTLKGDVMKYCGGPGLKNLTEYTLGESSSNGGSSNGGNTGGTTTTPTTLLSETFASGQGQFTIENVTLPSGLTYVWKADTSYGYMKASAYANSTYYATESWLISPEVAIPSGANAVLAFEHVVNKFASLSDAKANATLWVRTVGGTWAQVTIPEYSTNANWTFVSSGDISLSSYAGKTIQFGFKYTSSTTSAGSWEIKNVTVSTK
jgi:hypothetical protein